MNAEIDGVKAEMDGVRAKIAEQERHQVDPATSEAMKLMHGGLITSMRQELAAKEARLAALTNERRELRAPAGI